MNAGELQKMFRAAYIVLHSNCPSGKLRLMFDTKKVMVEKQ